jgi:hypothetical protein
MDIQPLCLQPHSVGADGPAGTLGRVIFADLGQMVGVGAVREVVWDTDPSIRPLTPPREDKKKLWAKHQKHKREKWRAKRDKWVQVLRTMPERSLKITGAWLFPSPCSLSLCFTEQSPNQRRAPR